MVHRRKYLSQKFSDSKLAKKMSKIKSYVWDDLVYIQRVCELGTKLINRVQGRFQEEYLEWDSSIQGYRRKNNGKKRK